MIYFFSFFQAAFERRCPNFLSRLRDREAVLAQIKSEREIRAEKKREWVRLYGKSPDDLEELDAMLPPKGMFYFHSISINYNILHYPAKISISISVLLSQAHV